ncbi:cathepsin B isoform X2 [Bemisia tabaci]|uniref:cathepsin B isoform X2 n=1 Tax=Bemisia tabaci TaxID=7038 RepID=UPI003B2888D8
MRSRYEINNAVFKFVNYLRLLWEAFCFCGALNLLPALARDIFSGDSETFNLKNQDAMIEYINRVQTSWTAGRNFPDDTDPDYLKRLVSAWRPERDEQANGTVSDDLEEEFHVTYSGADPPAEFDARKKWTNCPSLSHIYDQGNCGGCWAVSSASVITDRICISSDGKFKDMISAWEILSCCDEDKCRGCDGGLEKIAFKYYKKHGVVTGGEFGTNQGCMPYQIKPCTHHMGRDGRYKDCDSYNETVVPSCKTECPNKSYQTPYAKDRHFGKRAYQVKAADLKKELFEFGPVTMSFEVFADFPLYKSGIYHHVTGKSVGWHAVRVIGYGPGYYLATNSWNSEWGDNGLVKFKSGTNECSNEEDGFQTASPKE